jgi:hypothetical protein
MQFCKGGSGCRMGIPTCGIRARWRIWAPFRHETGAEAHHRDFEEDTGC